MRGQAVAVELVECCGHGVTLPATRLGAPLQSLAVPDAALPETWTAVVNPVSGRGRTRKLLPELRSAFARLGPAVEVVVSEDAEHPAAIAEEATDAGRGVVACGGDGLVAQLAGVVAERDGTLAIVPTGSGNDLARHLGLDLKGPIESVDLLRTGRVRRIDLGRADGRWFTTIAGAGFDSEINRWANGVDWIGGTPLYVLAVLRTLWVYRPQPVRVTVDDAAPRELEAWFVAVGNSSSYGGGMRIAPGARLDDGLLDVVVVGATSRLELLRAFPRVFRGTHLDHPQVDCVRGRRVRIESPDASPPMELYASGEHVGALPAELEAVPNALEVVVPD